MKIKKDLERESSVFRNLKEMSIHLIFLVVLI